MLAILARSLDIPININIDIHHLCLVFIALHFVILACQINGLDKVAVAGW